MNDLHKFNTFIQQHHVMSLATHSQNELSVCSLFYVYDEKTKVFVVASSEDTTHITQVKDNAKVAGNILLETKEIGKIQGLQFQGIFLELQDINLKKLYFKAFPYALALAPKLWKIEISSFKLTDNRLGFGKKLIWP